MYLLFRKHSCKEFTIRRCVLFNFQVLEKNHFQLFFKVTQSHCQHGIDMKIGKIRKVK